MLPFKCSLQGHPGKKHWPIYFTRNCRELEFSTATCAQVPAPLLHCELASAGVNGAQFNLAVCALFAWFSVFPHLTSSRGFPILKTEHAPWGLYTERPQCR